ncbi:MAG: ABC transporter substrate-binding protein [Gammaproteobacteria bacterium]|jgi:phospholipid transport system substrate-binding protein|nr:ABC transporter substrate-binding protein [Gammaproteobacteria bacterium]MBU2178068.1 ABC transporter substrate-binding protein [Gammaproteobacteria bacterium]MBU2222901.1 ABC transporter substrate-binding protein [Gammaproteobacteria bacterium]MBU2425793.1 ABC transporter substrate-binding protein [Gammaproteobacteria bacterium]
MKLFIKLASVLLLAAGFNTQANTAVVQSYDDPYKMMEVLVDKTFRRIAADQSKIKQNAEVLRTIVTEELVPYIDSRYAAGYVIGQSVKLNTVPKEEFNTFVIAFQNYMVGTYAGVFTQYTNQKVIIEPGQPIDKQRKIIIIKTRVIDPGKPDINIEFKLRRMKDSNNWLVYDMIAEGISLLDSKRSELGSLIRQQGLLSVAALLEEKAKAPIRAPEKKKDA